MRSTARVLLTITLGLYVALAGCSSNTRNTTRASYSAAAPGTWNGAPTGDAMRVKVKPAQGESALRGWRVNATLRAKGGAGFVFIPKSGKSPARYELRADGNNDSSQVFSPPIRVKPGKVYAFSALVASPPAKTGSMMFWVSNGARTKVYGSAKVPYGQNGRYGFTVRIPEGVTRVRFGYHTAGTQLSKGQKITFSEPAAVQSPG